MWRCANRYFAIISLLMGLFVVGSSLECVAQNNRKRKTNQQDSVEFGSQTVQVEEVVVSGKRRKYNRDNPAVELAKQLIASRDSLNPFVQKSYIEYEKYEKIVISLNDYQDLDSNKKMAFLNEHKMINPQSGKPILPISLREKILLVERNNQPQRINTTALYSNNQGVDNKFSESTVLSFLDDAIPDINIFDDHIYLVQRQFVSPLAKGAFNFYKFFLASDTINYQGRKCVTLSFFPFSQNSLALRGKFIVEIDTTGAKTPFVRYVDLSIPNSADVNFISDIYIEQSYSIDSSGLRVIEWDSASFDASPIKKTPAINIRRLNYYSDYSYLTPLQKRELDGQTLVLSNDQGDGYQSDIIEYQPLTFKDSLSISVANSKKDKKTKNDSLRKPTINIEKFAPTQEEIKVVELSKRMRKMPLYVIAEELLLIAVEGYFQTGKKSYFDIGPVAQFISGNTLEGSRIALGGITTPNLCPYIFFDGLVAYGFDDKKLKYDLSLEFSFNKKKDIFKEFPVHSLRATYTYDVHRFGERFDKLNGENIFSWAKRSGDYNLTYVRLAQLRYLKEWKNNFALSLYARHYTNYETNIMPFGRHFGDLPSYSMSELEARIRYAPGDVIYQTRNRRRSMNKYIPTFELSHIVGFKDFLGGTYRRNLTEFSGFGRINVQPFGYINLNAKVGAEWNAVPYMLLPHPQTNMSYMTASESSFSLMQPLEYLYDRYIYVGFNYHLDGLIFSRLPLIKKLNLREVFSFRGVYGALTDKNNPVVNTNLLPLPVSSSPIGREPYMEVGVGIDNILSIFRVDYVWRITYLDKPNVERGAILFSFHLKF